MSGSHESRRLLNEAMKNGKIESSITKILLYDCSRRGKSSFVNLILDINSAQDDDVSHATNSITAYEVDPTPSSNNKWKKIDKHQILARAIRQEGAKLEMVDNDQDNTEGTELQVKSKNLLLVHTAEQSSISENFLDTAEPPKQKKMRLEGGNRQERITSTCDTAIKFMDHEPSKSVIHRIKFIDSGGHPLFHEVLPGFLHHANLFISVLELSEKLSSKPMINFEHHNQNVGTSFESAQTYQQLLEHCLRTLDSHKGEHSKIMIIGTHNDHNMYTNEILKERNEKLRKILLCTRYRDMVVYNGDNAFMFPVNTENPKEQEICQIQKIILDECKSKPIEIPLQYFGLEILLEEVSKEQAKTVLSKSEFKRFAAARLHFDEHKLDGALQFLHDISEVFYFPEILPDVVFTNPQVILDKMIELVEAIHLYRNKKLPINDSKTIDFKDYALFCTKFLSRDRFQKHYVPGVFTQVELVKLFREMLIIADFDNSKYFMPSLLNILEEDKISVYRVGHDSPAAPLALNFPGPQLGIYCSLTCFLVSPDNQYPKPWEIKKTELLTPSCLYRNCIQFTLKKHVAAADIVLIDTFTHFEVHVKLPVKAPELHHETCQYIRKAILEGLNKVTCDNNSMPSLVFVCPCGKGNPHVAYATKGHLICSTYDDYQEKLTENQRIWKLDPEITGMHGIANCSC